MDALWDGLYKASVWILPALIAITLHEAAHGFAANMFGDDTAKRMGRMSLNPLRHVDPFGTIILPGLLLLVRSPFLFGYAKPVPVNFYRLNPARLGMILVAAAGPAMNIVLAILAALGLHLVGGLPDAWAMWAEDNLKNAAVLNVVLAVFNMLPIPPLDGGRVLVGLLPRPLAFQVAKLERVGILIVLGALVLLPMIGNQLGIDLSISPWLIGGRSVSVGRDRLPCRPRMSTVAETFEEQQDAVPDGERLVVDVDGYEGPIDVLLALAREQKVDLKKISILALVEQYLVFVQAARRVRLELAADYLVMAAWLAYLKSRLLLPEPAEDDEPSGEAMAEALAFQLLRLEAMQQMAVKLMARPRLGVDTFPRGETIDVRVKTKTVFDVTLYDLLSAYGEHKSREETHVLHIAPTELHAVEDAIKRLEALLGHMVDWQSINIFLPESLKPGIVTRSAIAATLIASLEMAKIGRIEIKQTEPFGPIFLRAAKPS